MLTNPVELLHKQVKRYIHKGLENYVENKKDLLEPEQSIITTFLEIFDDKKLENSHLWLIVSDLMFRCICYPIFKLLILPSKITTPLILGRIRKLRKANLRRMFYCKRLNRISNKALQLDNQLCIHELLNQGFHFKI